MSAHHAAMRKDLHQILCLPAYKEVAAEASSFYDWADRQAPSQKFCSAQSLAEVIVLAIRLSRARQS
jgi:hypothetical protein